MTLSKQKTIDLIQVTESGVVQVREATCIIEDGREISRTYHRHCVMPGQDYSAEDARVQAICVVAHTPDIVTAYQESLLP